MSVENLKRINKWLFLISSVLTAFIGLLGIFFYTPEYQSIKDIFDYKISISILFSSIIIIAIFWCIFFFIRNVCTLIDNLGKTPIPEESSSLPKTINVENSIIYSEIQDKALLDAIEDFVKSNATVIGVQLYNYTETFTNDGKQILYDVLPTMKMYIKDSYSINLIKERYTVTKLDLDKYVHARKDYYEGNYQTIEKFISEMVKYFMKFNGNLSSKNANERDIVKFCLLILANQLYMGPNLTMLNDIDKNVFNYFTNSKRTGFLRAIIHDDYYKFEYESKGEKNNRNYIVRPVYINNKAHLFVITVNLNIAEKSTINSTLDSIAQKFYDILEKELKVIKNDYQLIPV